MQEHAIENYANDKGLDLFCMSRRFLVVKKSMLNLNMQ
ncbi:hypothetical protein [Lysinibacillus agricola]